MKITHTDGPALLKQKQIKQENFNYANGVQHIVQHILALCDYVKTRTNKGKRN